MKRAIITLVSLIIYCTSFSQNKPKIKIEFSELYATYSFIQQLSENYPENEQKKIFLNSKYNTKKNNDLINQINSLNIFHSINFDEYPKGQTIPLMTSNIINKNLISSKHLSNFKEKTFGIIPSSELLKLSNTIQKFLPIYKELIYEPNKENFENKITELKNYIEKQNFNECFEMGLKFYNIKWDNSITFKICVIPTLNKNGFTASAFMNNAVSEIQMDFKEYDILFSVLMHEIFHIQYNEQELEFKKSIDRWFKENTSQNSQYAYLLLNEVLATALGNGHVYKTINGKLDTDNWYNNKYINLMAKRIYPIVNEYIKNEKAIDKKFIDDYISTYDENYSKWVNELNHILTYRYIISDYDKGFDFFLDNYYKTSYSFMENNVDIISINKMKKMPVTKIVIITKNNKEKLKLLKSVFSELKNLKFKAKKEFIKIVNLKDKTKMIIVNSTTQNTNQLLSKRFVKEIL